MLRTSFYQFIVMLFSTCTGYFSDNAYTAPPAPIEEYAEEEKVDDLTELYYEEEAIEGNISPQKIGYVYGILIAMQLNNPQMGLTEEEKNIDKIVEGFKVGLQGDSAKFYTSLDVIRDRFTSQTTSNTLEEAENLAYNLGVNGLGIGGLALEVNFDKNVLDFVRMKKGYEDQIAGQATMDSVQINEVLQDFLEPYYKVYQEKMQKKQQEKEVLLAEPNIEAGRLFLAENAKKEGITTLPSGLQYKIIKEGTGNKPISSDKIVIHYHGTLIDGTVFDSSVERGEPVILYVYDGLEGWIEGLQLMKEGAIFEFYIPHNLAYGTSAVGANIPAGSTLIFDIELIEINPK